MTGKKNKRRSGAGSARPEAGGWLTARRAGFLVLAVVMLAAALRFWNLENVPPGFYYDEAINANNALETLRGGHFRIYYRDYCDLSGYRIADDGREGMMVWILAAFFYLAAFFGGSGLSVALARAGPALFGTLTVFGTWLLAGEMLKQLGLPGKQARSVALAAALLLAVSFWHLQLSRIALRVILEPCVLVFAFFFLLRGLRREKTADILAGSVIFGLGFYTYIPFRVAPLLLPLIIVPWHRHYRAAGRTRRFTVLAAAGALTVLLVALPILVFFARHPEFFLERVSAFDEPSGHSLSGQVKSFFSHLGMFSVSGDSGWRHNIAGRPMLPLPVSIMLAAGIATLAGRIRKALRGGDRPSLSAGLLLAAWPLLMMLPSVLTGERLNQALRTVSVIPPVCLLAALGGWRFCQAAAGRVNRRLLGWAVVLVLAAVAFHDPFRYFRVWAVSPEAARAFDRPVVKRARLLAGLPPGSTRVVLWNSFGLTQVAVFIERTAGWRGVSPDADTIYLPDAGLDVFTPDRSRETVFIPLFNGSALSLLKERYPEGVISFEEGIALFTVPARTRARANRRGEEE